MVIPFEVDADVLGRVHVKFDWVIFSDGCNEVVNISFVFIFYAKVVNNKSKRYLTGFMFE